MQTNRLRVAMGIAWILLSCLIAGTAQARMKKVDPGEDPTLQSDEGFVLMAVDTDINLSNIRLNREGRDFGSGSMNNIKIGTSYRLFVAPAGDYQWRRIDPISTLRYSLRDDPEFKFKVAPGVITYAGDLLFRPKTVWRADIAMVNRSLAAIDWMERTHPAIQSRYRFEYSGHYPDPFPAFYKEARARHPDTHPVAEAAPKPLPPPGTLPLPIKTLWRQDRIHGVEINPRGDLLAILVREAEDDWHVDLIDLRESTLKRMANSAAEFDQMHWAGDDALLVSSEIPMVKRVSQILRFGLDGNGKRTVAVLKLPEEGYVTDPLPQDPDHVLFASWANDGSLLIHRMAIDSQKSIDRTPLGKSARLNVGVKDDVLWFTDGVGNLSLALAKREDDYVLVHRNGDAYQDVMTLTDDDDEFNPVGVSYDGREIYALTDKDRSQRDLVVYDIAQRKMMRTLFSKPDVDVDKVLFGDRRVPIGVSYFQGGRRLNEYFDDSGNQLERQLQAAFPGRNIAIADRSQDGKQVILWVDAGDQPPQLYHLDRDKRQASLVGETMPWLRDVRFAPTELVRFKGVDGRMLDAFLTLPPGEGKRPLIVFPHGGPVGVADTLAFDREVQFIASLGYAVLRVNYRGSAGYGKAFREAGYHAYGTAIEDDIDAAIREVLSRHPVDEKRMCAVGSSYGGYSALILSMRWPDRFRCAVSIAGVSDRILFFTASDSAHNEKGRKLIERIIGDPNKQLEEMKKTSPLYRFDEIRVPVMLAHGREDRRVDYEHMRRLLRMLDMAGRTPVGVVFDKEAHGVDDEKNIEVLWNGVAGFLRQYLGDGKAVSSSGASPSAAAPGAGG